ncbi:DUF3768 domain-containing protein [Novispirillum sp. DQ9]|uniref:DUF3768 domain-containing protein n=1 Tax=Novispirillum sp. DQ9 TaxID=3398612 RepID=UPI003C798183
MSRNTAVIAALNDQLRKGFLGGHVMLTIGIRSLPNDIQNAIFEAVNAFDRFTDDNDPYGEHDCATLTVKGCRVIWKIDYYDRTMTNASPDPADRAQTVRVLTIMLAEEY